MMVELCELNPEILDWRHRGEVLEMMRRLSLRSQQRLVEFSHFIFWPQNEESVFSFAKEALKCNIGDITELMNTGSIGAHIINKAIDQETGISGLRWAQDNLYHFSLLYQFVDPNYVKNDYAAILWGFLTQLPKAAWSQPASNTFHETIDYFLSVLQKRTPNLKAVHMKRLGLNGVVAKYMLSYLQNAQPRIQEISELYDKRNEPVQFKTLLRNKLFGRISKAANRKKLMTDLKLNWSNETEDQTENLLEIVKTNQL